MSNPNDAAAAFLASQGIGTNNNAPAANKRKQRKKGKKKGAATKDDKAPSAMALKILEQKKAREEEERRLAEEQARIEAEEQAREEAERKEAERKEAIKQKKREKQKEKIARQKAEGTYMTKAQKLKQQKALSGVNVEEMKAKAAAQGGSASYKKKKGKKFNKGAVKEVLPVVVEEPVVVVEEVKEEEPQKTAHELEMEAAMAGLNLEEEHAAVEGEVDFDFDNMDFESLDIGDDFDLGAGMDAILDEDDIVHNHDDEEDLAFRAEEEERQRLKAASEKAEKDKLLREKKKREDNEARMARRLAEDEGVVAELNQKKARRCAPRDGFRAPIVAVLGHVDTGKTKILDKIRKTNVQEGEAGGITQQIGATWFPIENLRKETDKVKKALEIKYELPGLLVIDTPGHEQFTNLRSRGSNLCDIAILVVDLMHGLERQTLESLELLKQKKTPFIVALNKVDRCGGWDVCPNANIQSALSRQHKHTMAEFEDRVKGVQTQLMEQGFNCALHWENPNPREYLSMVPTSAHSGEGIPDLLGLIIKYSQGMLAKNLTFKPRVDCTVLEVKAIEGLGMTIDVVLVNGALFEGDRVIISTLNGPVMTTIRGLLTPHPMKEMRVKNEYQRHQYIEAAMGIKITAHNLDKALAGTPLYVVPENATEEDIEDLMDEADSDVQDVISAERSPEGVWVQASTLGSLEALLEYLKNFKPPVPVAGVSIGNISKNDIVRAAIMNERKKPEYATILAFDVKCSQEMEELAKENKVTIFQADIIYHLTDQFTEYLDGIKKQKQEDAVEAVFPCFLRIMPENVFNKRNPIVCGVEIVEGTLRGGTPLAAIVDDAETGKKIPLMLGKVTSMELNHKEVKMAHVGEEVCVKIEPNDEQSSIMFGRQFDEKNTIVSRLSRGSIDSLKEFYADEMGKEDWMSVVKLKRMLNIM
eukprot:TRINITY_DN621_c0_g1_i1.p1 TRINITY_DN621_c0_g1~~TRINITY_DN621_c0_g1_i1.p1  ORF type:complete len:929 (+),score=425.34 TRINITY_DN621_c0_g1_i1:86-2872(+)